MSQPILGATTLVLAMFLQPVHADNPVPAQTEAAPSKPLICLALPDLRLAGSTPAPAAPALRDLFSSQMQSGAIATKNLESTLPVQAVPEARQAGCGSILFVTATQVRPTAKLGFLRRALANAGTTAGGSMPVGDSAGSAVLRSVTMTGVYSAAQLVTAVKANDEIRLDFRLDSTADASSLTSGHLSAKAKADGEDVFAPLAAKVSNTILPAAKKAMGNAESR
jgi:hypothetical protein